MRRKELGRAWAVVPVLIVIAAAGYGAYWWLNQPTPINDIVKQPDLYIDKTVEVRGTVTKSFTLPGLGLYELTDDSGGSIWVLPAGSAPSKDAEVSVKGTVRKMFEFSFGGLELRQVVLVEAGAEDKMKQLSPSVTPGTP